jgi:UDP-arabinose 4-epimerase
MPENAAVPAGSNSKAVLVTGGAGYIGSHTCKALAAAGYTPVTYDDLSAGHRWAVKWGPLEAGGIADRRRLDAVIDKWRPNAVMHFAGRISVAESVEEPALYYRDNVAGTLVLLEAVRSHGIQRFVFSSSAAVYGIPRKTPIPEDHRLEPVNPYGRSKFMVERILADIGRAHGISSVSLRYFNAAGADPDGQIGEDHDPETHLVPIVLAAALGRRGGVSIYGTDYDTDDGTCIRDYIHVSDLADAHVLALEHLEKNSGALAVNVGVGRGYSVREVIETAEAVTGRSITADAGGRRAGDAPVLVASARKARELFGWRPKRSGLDNILRTAFHWHERHKR